MEMLDRPEKLEKGLNGRNQLREDSEYVRLVVSNEPRIVEGDALQPRAETKYKSFIWWMKAIFWCFIVLVVVLIFVKWGVPFLFEKVFPYPFLFVFFFCEGLWLLSISVGQYQNLYKTNDHVSLLVSSFAPLFGRLIHLLDNMSQCA